MLTNNNNNLPQIDSQKPLLPNDQQANSNQFIFNVYPNQSAQNIPVIGQYPQLPTIANNNAQSLQNLQYNQNIINESLGDQYVYTRRRVGLNFLASQILSITPFMVPQCNLQKKINCYCDCSNSSTQILDELVKANQGIQTTTITNSIYYRTITKLLCRIKKLGLLQHYLSIIFFFMTYIALMVRMFANYIDVYYVYPDFPYYVYRESEFNCFTWLYSIFFALWLIDILWNQYLVRHISSKAILVNLLYKLFILEIYYIVIYMIDITSLNDIQAPAGNQFVSSIIAFILAMIFLVVLIIIQSLLHHTSKKLFMLTKDISIL